MSKKDLKIEETMDYDMFELHEVNRDVMNNKELEDSMRKHGFISAYPIHVVKGSNGRLRIKAGHNRFVVAKRLNIPVKYVICDDAATIHELEKATKPWAITDYLASWCRAGKVEYLEIRNYNTKTGIAVSLAASMFFGNQAGSGNHYDAFKSGSFRIKDREHPEAVADIVLHMKACGISFSNTTLFVQALSRMLYVPEFKPEVFKMKVKNHTFMVVKKANLQQYLGMIADIYNRQNKDKKPLVYLANEAAKARNICYRGKKPATSVAA